MAEHDLLALPFAGESPPLEPPPRLRVIGRLQPHDPSPEARLERPWCIQCNNPTCVDQRDAARHLGLLHVVRREENRPARVGQRAHVAPEHPPRIDVEAQGGLVEKEDGRIRHEGAGKLQLAPLSAGKLFRRTVAGFRKPQAFEKLRGAAAGDGNRQAVKKPHEEEIVASGKPPLDRGFLEDNAHCPPHRVPIRDDVVSEHPRRARRRRPEGCQYGKEGRLPGPVRPQQREHLAPLHREVNSPQRLDGSIRLHEPAHLHGGGRPCRR